MVAAFEKGLRHRHALHAAAQYGRRGTGTVGEERR